jgi:hypothetical protein
MVFTIELRLNLSLLVYSRAQSVRRQLDQEKRYIKLYVINRSNISKTEPPL